MCRVSASPIYPTREIKITIKDQEFTLSEDQADVLHFQIGCSIQELDPEVQNFIESYKSNETN